MDAKILNWKTKDGIGIQCRVWENESSDREIWIVHGMGDHGGRYLDLAEELVESGYRVIASDHRGNGLSEGKRGHVARFEIYLEDLQHTIERTASDRKRFILGQSMGSLIVSRYLTAYQNTFEKAVLMSPMFRTANPPPRMKLFLARIVRRIYPSLTLRAGIKSSQLTSNEGRREDLRRDELKHDLVSAELGLSLFEQGVLALAEADQIEIPTLVMHGVADKITCPEASGEFAARNERISLKLWDEMRHELHNESEREQVFAYLINWLKA